MRRAWPTCAAAGLRAVIVMPLHTRRQGRRTAASRGNVLHGDTLEEARAHALELAQREHLTFVHPYDDEAIVAGQGTVGIEMLEPCRGWTSW